MPVRQALNLDRRRVLMGMSALAAIAATPSPVRAKPADEARIDDLIRQMTLEEKAGQLTIMPDLSRAGAFANANPGQVAERNAVLEQVRDGDVGGLFNGVGAEGARELQRIAIEESRLKIPLIFGADIIHGYKTVFPIPLGETASFEPDLAERTARYAAIEASAAGLHWSFAPMVDVARDQRWGRVAEGAGEDVHLSCVFAAARVRGFQGTDLLADDSMLACPKHFAAYGAVTGGMDYGSADIPESTLREVHLPPFTASFEAGAVTAMSAFNDIAGVPASANRKLMTDILRGEMGFDGFVVSDYTADMELIAHGYAADAPDATQKALYAGVDMSMTSGFYRDHVPNLVREGRLDEAVVDEAVRRILRIKALIGLFDNPYRSLDPAREAAGAAPADIRDLGREAGRKSIVMLRNEGGLLPLSRDRKLALIGPFGADEDNLFGPWAWLGGKENVISLESGLRAAGANFTVVKGSEVEAPIEGGIDQAVAAARDADVVLLAIGEAQNMSGEAQSRTDIVVPAPQQALAEAVAATGKPVVVLLRHGRALALEGAVRDAQAILATWFLGSEMGHSVADILFGDHAPSGRLPVSFPQASGQQPYFYNQRRTGRPQIDPSQAEYKARYREVTHEALYPFGFGLTYGRVEYGPTRLGGAAMAANGVIEARCRVANVSDTAVDEVVQLYIHDRVASRTRPVRELKGFQKVRLAPGESRDVGFTLRPADLAFIREDLSRGTEPGDFDVWIAPDCVSGEAASFRLEA